MPLEIIAGDVLDSQGGALLLAVDGARRGLEGHVARGFGKKWPEEWEAIEHAARYPIPLGRAAGFRTGGDCPWSVVVLASTLHHLGVMPDEEKRRVATSGFLHALDEAIRLGAREVASAPFSGGWRLDSGEALVAMQMAYQAVAPRLGAMTVRIYRRRP